MKVAQVIITLISISFLFTQLVFAEFGDEKDTDIIDWSTVDIPSIDPFLPEYLVQVPQDKKQLLTPSQLQPIPPTELGDLGQYNPSAISQVLNANYGVTVSGDLHGATISNDVLTFPDGSSIVLDDGVIINRDGSGIDVTADDIVVIDGSGVVVTPLTVSAVSAVSIKDFVAGQPVQASAVTGYSRSGDVVVVDSASALSIGGSVLSNVEDVNVQKTPGGLAIQSFSSVNDNTLLFDSGVVPVTVAIQSGQGVTVAYAGDEVSFILPSGAIIEFRGAEGRTSAQTTISIKQIAVWLEVIAANTRFSYRNALLEESVAAIAKTIFRFSESDGIFFLRLGKDSRYTYQDSTRTFYLLNPADQEYTVFINKPSHQLALEDNTYQAYLDPAQGFFQLNGIITYGADGQDVVRSLDAGNTFTLANGSLTLQNENPACAAGTFISQTFTSGYEIAEYCETENRPEQYVNYVDGPVGIIEYASFGNPAITIADGILSQRQWYGLFQMFQEVEYCEESFTAYLEGLQCIP